LLAALIALAASLIAELALFLFGVRVAAAFDAVAWLVGLVAWILAHYILLLRLAARTQIALTPNGAAMLSANVLAGWVLFGLALGLLALGALVLIGRPA